MYPERDENLARLGIALGNCVAFSPDPRMPNRRRVLRTLQRDGETRLCKYGNAFYK